MTTAEIVAIVAACISLVAVLLSAYFSFQAKLHNEVAKANAARMQAFSAGQIETALRSEIRAARKTVRDASIALADATGRLQGDKKELSGADRKRLIPYVLNYEEAVEAALDAYEQACERYLDDKVDRERFKKTYFTEIANLIRKTDEQDGVTFHLLHPEGQSLFQAIWKVYREWYLLEK